MKSGESVDLDIYSGTVTLYGSEDGLSAKDVMSVTKRANAFYWHRKLLAGESITFDNDVYAGTNNISNQVRLYGFGSADSIGKEIQTDYYWKRHMGWDEEVNTYDMKAKTFWRVFSNCQKGQYSLDSGYMVFCIRSDQIDKIKIY